MMKNFFIGLIAIVAVIVLAVVIYAIYGAVFYFGLSELGVDMTFAQAVVIALLISVTGQLFGGKQAKGDE